MLASTALPGPVPEARPPVKHAHVSAIHLMRDCEQVLPLAKKLCFATFPQRSRCMIRVARLTSGSHELTSLKVRTDDCGS